MIVRYNSFLFLGPVNTYNNETVRQCETASFYSTLIIKQEKKVGKRKERDKKKRYIYLRLRVTLGRSRLQDVLFFFF